MATRCPICNAEVERPRSDAPHSFPFCSPRCRTIDLGNWLDDRYTLPETDSVILGMREPSDELHS
ncbi:MAG: DNA gyrase inhibitor YacG [Myxococcota bacterium]